MRVVANARAQSELRDLHSEFEVDRQNYLDQMREQNKHIKLLQQIVGTAFLPSDLEKFYDRSTWNDQVGG